MFLKDSHREDIDDSVKICQESNIDGIHYDKSSHTMFCTTTTETEKMVIGDKQRFIPGSKRTQRWFDSPGTLNEKVRPSKMSQKVL